MKTYVLDTNVLLTYVQNRTGAEAVDKIFSDRTRGSVALMMSAVNWGEAFYILRRHADLEHVKRSLAPLRAAIEILSVSTEAAENAAELKSVFKLGYADAFAAELAIDSNATLVSSDPVFKKLGKNLDLRLLPSKISN